MDIRLDKKEYLSPEDIIRLLDISRTKCYELLRSGEIENYKIGRLRRAHWRAVEAYLERNKC